MAISISHRDARLIRPEFYVGRLDFAATEELCYVLAVTTCGADKVSKEPTVQT